MTRDNEREMELDKFDLTKRRIEEKKESIETWKRLRKEARYVLWLNITVIAIEGVLIYLNQDNWTMWVFCGIALMMAFLAGAHWHSRKYFWWRILSEEMELLKLNFIYETEQSNKKLENDRR